MANFNFSLGFNIEKEGINKAKQELSKLKQEMQTSPMKFGLDQNSLKAAMQQVSAFEDSLEKAFNQNLGKLDTREFVRQLHAAGYSLTGLKNSFSSMGIDAKLSMSSIEKGLESTNLSLKKTNKLVGSMGTTFSNSLKWNIASQTINGIQSNVSRAIGFVKELDRSLNDIQIVSGKNKDEMNEFADSANKAAQALGKTTTEYADASLIYYQQGKTEAEVKKLTQATLIGANITGQDTAETSELLTAALNGYSLAADKAMLITDKFAAVGAGTGSDFSELAIGFSKVASMASVAGVSVDQLNGMLATTSTITREAPESIGTSYKTIFGRMTEMKAGKADENGWKLGQVNDVISKAGFSMLDETTGKLKDTGVLIEEIGNKWADLNKETKLALSTAMAGSRQQNRLVALYENWDMYKEAVKMSQEAEGTAYDQNIVKMDSIEIKSKQLRASLEEMWMKIIDSDAMKGMLDILTSIVEKTNDFVDALGGIEPILAMIAAVFARIMSGKISNGVFDMGKNIKDVFAARTRNKELRNATDSDDPLIAKHNKRLQEQHNIRKYLSQEEHKEYIILQKTLETEERKLDLMEKNIKKSKEFLAGDAYKGDAGKLSTKMAENDVTISANRKAMNQLMGIQKGNITKGDQINQKTLATINRLLGEGSDLKAKDLLADKEANKILGNTIEKLNQKKELAEKENALLKEHKKYLSDEYELAKKEQMKKVAETEEYEGADMKTISDKANSVGKIESAIGIASAATVAILGVKSAVDAFNEADSSTDKAEATTAGIMSISAALSMIPHPAAQAAGAILGVVTTIGKLIYDNTGLRKIIKDNKKLVEETTLSITEAKTELGNLSNATTSFNSLKTLMQNGALSKEDLKTEDLEKYYSLCDNIADLAPDMVKFYDDQGHAVIDLTKNINDLRDAQKTQILEANKTKASNAEGFGEEYGDRLKTAKSKISENQKIINIMNQGETALARYNYISNNDYGMSDRTKLVAEIQTQQAELQAISEEINANIVNPVFEGNKAYQSMTDKQKNLVHGLFDIEKATKLAYNPKQLASYTRALDYTLNQIGEESSLIKKSAEVQAEIDRLKAKDVLRSDEKIKLQSLIDENTAYGEQLKTVTSLNAKFETLGKTKQNSVLKMISSMSLEEEDMDTAFTNLTDYYSNTDVIAQGPMTSTKAVKAAGVSSDRMTTTGVRKATEGRNDAVDKVNEEIKSLLVQQDDVKQRIFKIDGSTEEEQRQIELLKTKYDEYGTSIDNLREKKIRLDVSAMKAMDDALQEIDINAELAKQYWDQIDSLTSTVEGYNQVAEAYNKNLSAVEELNNAQAALAEGSSLTKEQMDGVAGTLENYRDTIPGLSLALDKYNTNGAASFEGLSGYMEEASNTMMKQNQRMYASLNKDNTEYYIKFKAQNKEQTNLMFKEYGIRAEDYSTFADYEQALNTAKEKGKLNVFEQGANEKLLMLEQENQGVADSAGKQAGIWSLMTSDTLGFFDKLHLGVLWVFDKLTGFVADIVNGIIGNLNIAIGALQDFVNDAIDGYNAVARVLPGGSDGSVSHVDWKINYRAIGTDSYGTKLDKILKKKAKEKEDNFNYDVDGLKTITRKNDLSNTPSGDEPSNDGRRVDSNTGGSSTKAKVQEDMKVDFDTLVLHDTNILLQQQEDLLKRLKNEEDKLYGKAKMDNLTKQNEALARKKEILQQQLAILKQHASEMRATLQSQGAQFNNDGTISNYEAIIKAKVASANSISDADAKKDAQDAVKQFMDDLKQYEDYQLKVTFDKEQAISEVEKLQREIFITQFEYKITVQLELSKDQEEIIKFLKDVNNEFEDMSDTYKETMNDLNGTLGAVGAIQEQLDKTLKDTTLTDKERIELLGKYEKEMEDAVTKAQKLREELVKLNEEALKGGLGLLDEQLNKYENIGKELDHITNMLKLTGNQQEFSVIDKIYEAQEKGLKGQLDALLKTKTLLSDMLSKQVEGSKEWKVTNEQLVKMNEQINKITEETLKTFQEEFNNSFNSIMDKLDKQLSGGMGFDKLKDRWSELKSDGEKYLSTQEKIIWAGNMQYDIQQKLNESTNPETRKRLQEFLDEELNTLTKKGTLTEYEVDRAKKLYDITVAQIALDEARNNKTIQRLVRDSSGNWSYQYMEDTKKVAEAQKSLTDKTQALMDSDKKAFIENQDEMIAAKIAFEKEIEDIIKQAQNGQYASEEKFQAALVEAKTRFETRITTLQKEGDSIRQYSSESTMAAILATYTVNKGALETLTAEQKILLEELGVNVGISWNNIREALKATNVGNAEDYKTLFTDIVIGHGENMSTELSKIYDSIGGLWDTTTGKMTISNINLSTVVNTTIEAIKNSWQEYQNKVNEVTLVVGGDLQSLITETEALGSTTTKLGTETINTITSIQDQWDKVAELINEYQKLDGTQYDAIVKAAIEYIKQLDDIIKKQKEVATGIATPKVDTPTKTPTTTPPATTPSKPVAAPAPSKPSTPSVGDTVSVIPNTWTSDSYGRGPTGNPWSWSWGPWRIDQYIPGRAYPYHVAATDGVSGTGWVNSVKFDTGGYTGEWGDNEGKMAMLHQKEIVLNKEDTSNILSAVQIVRDYASMIKKLVGGVGSFAPSTGGAVEQSVTINADFSGVKSSFEIEKAFENMANRASQFIQRK